MSPALSLSSLPCCRSEGAREGTMVVFLFTPVQAGQHLVVHIKYTASLTSGLTRSAAFDYAEPVTGQLQSQVCFLGLHSRLCLLSMPLGCSFRLHCAASHENFYFAQDVLFGSDVSEESPCLGCLAAASWCWKSKTVDTSSCNAHAVALASERC